jgi:ankyrin repeat protein
MWLMVARKPAKQVVIVNGSIEAGGEIEAIDTYGYHPLHRMASNNLAIGAQALIDAGADVFARTDRGETPIAIARSAGAGDVLSVLTAAQNQRMQDA